MSSTLSAANFAGHDFGAAQCIDGVTNNDNGWNFCISNLNVADPWLSVEVPAGSSVTSVVVYSREDCCQRFLGTFEVWVGNVAGSPSSATATRCGVLTADLTTGPFTVRCSTALSGSVVTLLLPGAQRGIVLAEVTAYGSAGAVSPFPPPPPPSSPTAQTAGTEAFSGSLADTGCYSTKAAGSWGFCGPYSCNAAYITCPSEGGGPTTVGGVTGTYVTVGGTTYSSSNCQSFLPRTSTADITNWDPPGRCDSTCTQQTTGVCSASFLASALVGDGVKYAYCNDKWLVITSSGASSDRLLWLPLPTVAVCRVPIAPSSR